MKVLWVVNTIFPDLSRELELSEPTAGGWMYGLARDLVNNGISLTVATARPDMHPSQRHINGISYYLLRGKKDRTRYDVTLEPQWAQLVKQVQPEIVHIHGTEYAHGLSLIHSCPHLNYVTSIQGMTSVYWRYYLGGMTKKEILLNYTFRDIFKQDSIIQGQTDFKRRGSKVEVPYIKKTNDIIGRTQWDHDHVKTINPNCNYHFCNESLRDPFYTSPKWNPALKKEFTIFLSQAGYPLKGLHQVIKAVSLIIMEFPGIQIRVAGNDITNKSNFRNRLRYGGYGKFIDSLLKKFRLHSHIEFTGPLNAEEMAAEYLNAHLFICPSSIENSPNSLGEAQLLGVPCIASYVGGVPDMVKDGESGLLYRFEEVEMLAQAIRRIFNNPELAGKLSLNAIKAAALRHDRQTNAERMIEIYNTIKL